MRWFDYLITIIGAICTILSFIGAYKSVKYYKKSKQLTIFANTNIACIESAKIIVTLSDMLKLANEARRQRGTSNIKDASIAAESIKASINKIRESLPVNDFKDVQSILYSREFKVETYIDTIIMGSLFPKEGLIWDDDFQTCQEIFCEVQLLIKEKLDKIAESIK